MRVSFPKSSYNFYPRPPRGGRPCSYSRITKGVLFLSTPSARRATRIGWRSPPTAQFLSTPSARRETVRCGLLPPTRYDFYPRPPRGGRPCSCRRRVPPAGISIHALREEGDITVLIPNTYSKTFLSTPSARRATVGKIKAQGAALFLSTPSARRATMQKAEKKGLLPDFYPRPPRGGRPL